MILNKRRAAIAATVMSVAVLAAACGNGSTETVTAPEPVATADGGSTDNGGIATMDSCPIDQAHRVGAMADFGVNSDFRATEPITVDFLYGVWPDFPPQDDWLFFTSLRDDHNVTIDRDEVLLSDWDIRRSTVIAAGDFPTVVTQVWGGQEGPWWAGGGILPISQFLGCMPNFSHFVNEWGIAPQFNDTAVADGNIYNLQSLRQSPELNRFVVINTDLFEQAGANTNPATFDEFAEALQLVQDNTDVDYAFSDRWNTQTGPLGAMLNISGPAFGTSGGWNRNPFQFDHDAGEFVVRAGTEQYRSMIEFFANLRAAGVMDQELTQSDDEAISKFINGRSAAIGGDFTSLNTMRAAAAELGINLNAQVMMIPAGPAGNLVGGSQLGPGIVLNNNIRNNPNFLAILQFLDWLYYSDNGREFAQWGIEGVTFNRLPDGTRVLAEDLGGAEATNATDLLQQQFGFRNFVFMPSWGSSDDLVTSVMTPEQRAWTLAMADRVHLAPLEPGVALTEAEQDELAVIQSTVQDATDAAVAEFLVGRRPMSEWDAFVTQLRGLGADRIVEVMNGALARSR